MDSAHMVVLGSIACSGLDDAWLQFDHAGPVEATPENVEAARAFVLDRWRERAHENGLPEPADLSSACKFCALFAKALFGGSIDGHYEHLFNRVGGGILDLSEASADVGGMDAPYRTDLEFLASEDLHYSLQTCLPRVRAWVAAFPAAPASAPRP
ncbi:hypothetical protein BHAOGJBA_5158 [Methylobacterium hispanicum]|uniref:HEPN domain-containing protein n=1 Tax=Methylobacterium hispanicum TaxID=270350 RepID=A0AAV4ZSS4_9HYPH|nr:hypothetical protein [Methylobacterium hispanicum]GJD91610.1 hypothetical protein BHAOGJBA_5158 [Methylobacterium hispanicum]